VSTAANCAPFTFFSQHNLIFDTTLWCAALRVERGRSVLTDVCSGAWAGAAWAVSGTPGQEQSCAVRTGVADCVTFVRTRGDAFANACTWPCARRVRAGAGADGSLCRLGGEERQDLPDELSGRTQVFARSRRTQVLDV
jgi:hypothetical protein